MTPPTSALREVRYGFKLRPRLANDGCPFVPHGDGFVSFVPNAKSNLRFNGAQRCHNRPQGNAFAERFPRELGSDGIVGRKCHALRPYQ
jgi:hypothetical protein